MGCAARRPYGRDPAGQPTGGAADGERGPLPLPPYRLAEGSCSARSRSIGLRKPRALGVKASLPPQTERGMDPTHRVLIIDDYAVNRRMAQVVFQKLGWEAETVDSGERALLSLTAHRYDLVLLDISMPGMNGLEVCQRIRADRVLAGLRQHLVDNVGNFRMLFVPQDMHTQVTKDGLFLREVHRFHLGDERCDLTEFLVFGLDATFGKVLVI